MRLLFLLLGSFVTAAHANDASYFAEPVSCTGGPFGLRLPASYEELRRLGTLRDDRVLPGQIGPTPAAEQRELTFNGLRLTILRTKLDPANSQVSITPRGSSRPA